jgi:hypothetical protein
MVNIVSDIKPHPFQTVKSNFHVPLLFFRPNPTLFHFTPRAPIDTKSFSTRETTGEFVLVKFESKAFLSNRGRTKSGTDRRTDRHHSKNFINVFREPQNAKI